MFDENEKFDFDEFNKEYEKDAKDAEPIIRESKDSGIDDKIATAINEEIA